MPEQFKTSLLPGGPTSHMTFNLYVKTVDERALGRERDFIRDCRVDPKMPTINTRAEFDAYFGNIQTSTELRECMELAWKHFASEA